VFDNNFVKIGRPFGDLIIEDIARLKEVNARIGAQIAIIAVPANAAQEVADLLVEAGIRAILNFAPVSLKVPPHVHVRNVSFLQELAVLSYHLASDTDEASDSAQPLSCQQEASNGVRARRPAMRGQAIPAATTRTSPSKESSDAL
jgi:hypothetical protein